MTREPENATAVAAASASEPPIDDDDDDDGDMDGVSAVKPRAVGGGTPLLSGPLFSSRWAGRAACALGFRFPSP